MLVRVTRDADLGLSGFEAQFVFQFFGEQFLETPRAPLSIGSRVDVFAERKVWSGMITGIVTDVSNEIFYRVKFDGTRFEDDLRVTEI